VSDLGLGSYSSRRSSQGRDGVWPGGPLRSPAAEAVWQSSPGDGGPDRLLARLDKTVPVYKTVPGYPCRVPVPARPVPAPSDGPWRTGAAPRAAGARSSCVRRSAHGPVQEPSRLRRGRAETGLRVRNINDPSAGGPHGRQHPAPSFDGSFPADPGFRIEVPGTPDAIARSARDGRARPRTISSDSTLDFLEGVVRGFDGNWGVTW
jgi:hypothetical protein